MKLIKYIERILIATQLVTFLLLFNPDYFYRTDFFIFNNFLLSLFYIISGYWLFKDKLQPKRYILFRIFSGLIIGLSLATLSFTIIFKRYMFLLYIVALNGTFFLSLIVFIFLKRKNSALSSIKNVAVRSGIIFIVTAIFAFTPITSEKFHNLIAYINNGYPWENKININFYMNKYDKLYNTGECRKAYNVAKKAKLSAIKLGKRSEKYFWDYVCHSIKIFTANYNSSVCLAEEFKASGEIDSAIVYYTKALNSIDTILTCVNEKEWEMEEVDAYVHLANCHYQKNEIETAESLYKYAYQKYFSIYKDLEPNSFYLIASVTHFLEQEGRYDEILGITKLMEEELKNKTIPKPDNTYATILSNIAISYMQLDSMSRALSYINKCIEYADKQTPEYVKSIILKSTILLNNEKYNYAKKNAEFCLKLTDRYSYYKTDAELSVMVNALYSKILSEIGEYDNALTYNFYALQTIDKFYGKQNEYYYQLLLDKAVLLKNAGDYKMAESFFNQVNNFYLHRDKDNYNRAIVLSELAHLYTFYYNNKEALENANTSFDIASKYTYFNAVDDIEFLNTIGYVNYCNALISNADTLYQQSQNILEKHHKENSTKYAETLNGLALNNMDKHKYNEAEKQLNKSIEIYLNKFSNSHPNLATIYYNYARLKYEQKDLHSAKEHLNNAIEIYDLFYFPDHPFYADAYQLLGDIYKKEAKYSLAVDYYQKALNIYRKHFDDNHPELLNTKKKLDKLK